MICRFTVALVVLFATRTASADSSYIPPQVTLELCNELDIDAVQEAVAIELRDTVDSETKIMIACVGATATIRVLGAMHPRGRIVDVDLSAVEEQAMSRTIALIAAELWTAPEPEPVRAHAPSRGELSAKVSRTPKEKPLRTTRRRWEFGVGLRATSRDTFLAARDDDTDYALNSGTSTTTSFFASGRLFSWFGVFGNLELGRTMSFSGHNALPARAYTNRFEMGLYVPVYDARLRVDLRLSGGRDAVQIDRSTVDGSTGPNFAPVPDYTFTNIGLDLHYAIDKQWGLNMYLDHVSAEASQFNPFTTNPLPAELAGARWGGALRYMITKSWLAHGEFEIQSLRPGYRSTHYFDNTTSLELGLRYVF